MSALLQEAFEEIRLVSEAVREQSHEARRTSAVLRAHSTRLMERSSTLMARLAQFAPPLPEAIQQAESQLLAFFRDGKTPRQS